MNKYGEVKVSLHTFLTKGLDEYEWSASRFCHFFPAKEPTISIIQYTGRVSETIWLFKRIEKSLPLLE
jgi:hypothetical protein